jgi:hypothetical protein
MGDSSLQITRDCSPTGSMRSGALSSYPCRVGGVNNQAILRSLVVLDAKMGADRATRNGAIRGSGVRRATQDCHKQRDRLKIRRRIRADFVTADCGQPAHASALLIHPKLTLGIKAQFASPGVGQQSQLEQNEVRHELLGDAVMARRARNLLGARRISIDKRQGAGRQPQARRLRSRD